VIQVLATSTSPVASSAKMSLCPNSPSGDITMLRNTILGSSIPLMSHIGRKQLALGRVAR
jgi:hypothetical protein